MLRETTSRGLCGLVCPSRTRGGIVLAVICWGPSAQRRCDPTGRERDGSAGAEEPGKAGVATTASLNGMRRSEKAEVLEKA